MSLSTFKYLLLPSMAGGVNRFNRLSSKEWLPFQKSWFRFADSQDWINSNFRFFSTREKTPYPIFYHGPDTAIAEAEGAALGFKTIFHPKEAEDEIQFAFLDYRKEIEALHPNFWPALRDAIIAQCEEIFNKLHHRRFLMVAMPNLVADGQLYPCAWDLACRLGAIYTMKDEKIACLDDGSHFYTLYFRKDEQSRIYRTPHRTFSVPVSLEPSEQGDIPSWFVLRPQRRKKNEVVHPAKFPEELAEQFILGLTTPGQNVFDPMSGTGSTQVAALKHGRNGFGIELSSYFAEIARERCLSYLFDATKDPAGKQATAHLAFDVIQGDARKALDYGFSQQDLILTSPPYWDMLNMKGAENQAKRIKKGLQTNYSEDDDDLGNIDDYHEFVKILSKIYFDILGLLKPGGHLVVVVKNIKKKGKNYPFAWDLASLLREKLILLPTHFWCQDDISIAPYGYGNTFVSNTFHQYCLVFKKPKSAR